jgi:hypothetical protein
MSEDLFSYSNTGEPKLIVKEFIHEVVTSLYWLTCEADKVSLDGSTADEKSDNESIPQTPRKDDQKVYEEILHKKVREEREKLQKSIITSTLNLFGDGRENHSIAKANGGKSPVSTQNINRGNDSSATKARGSLSVIHRLEVLAFLKRARAAYGRTALCLSGGAMMGKSSHVSRGLTKYGSLL